MGLLDGDSSVSYGPKHRWKCPRQGCKKEVVAYTENGMRTLSEAHLHDHDTEDRERMIRFQNSPIRPQAFYNVLRLTWTDIQFLRTRGVKIESDMEWIDCPWMKETK